MEAKRSIRFNVYIVIRWLAAKSFVFLLEFIIYTMNYMALCRCLLLTFMTFMQYTTQNQTLRTNGTVLVLKPSTKHMPHASVQMEMRENELLLLLFYSLRCIHVLLSLPEIIMMIATKCTRTLAFSLSYFTFHILHFTFHI